MKSFRFWNWTSSVQLTFTSLTVAPGATGICTVFPAFTSKVNFILTSPLFPEMKRNEKSLRKVDQAKDEGQGSGQWRTTTWSGWAIQPPSRIKTPLTWLQGWKVLTKNQTTQMSFSGKWQTKKRAFHWFLFSVQLSKWQDLRQYFLGNCLPATLQHDNCEPN